MVRPTRHTLFGREEEEAHLARLMARAVASEGQAVFVVGEAGLGKTALLEQTALRAGGLGMHVRYGTAHASQQAHPFAVIARCLGVDGSAMEAVRARGGAPPRRVDVQGDGAPGARSAGMQTDLVTVQALLDLVDEMCARHPLALFLDDLQWADAASLRVLDRLLTAVHQMPLQIVCAFRPWPRVKEVEQLARGLGAGNRTVVELAPLGPAAVAALLAEECGGQPGPRLRHLADGAAGNPLYVLELAHALAREGVIESRGGIAEVPTSCSLPPRTVLITHRLSYLSDEVLHAVKAAAVMGETFTISELAAVLGKPAHDVVRVVLEAQAAGVLRDADDRLVFRHSLLRHALYDALPGPVRALLHLTTAQALASDGAPPEHVAQHLLDAAATSDGFLITWLLGSAPCLTVRAPALALQLLDRVVALKDPGEGRHVLLRLHWVTAQLSCGRLAEAEENARQLLARSRAPDAESRIRWLMVQAALARGLPDRALADARAACDSAHTSTVDGIRFRAFSSVCLLLLGQIPEAEAVAQTTRQAAQEQGDAQALAYALHTLAVTRFLASPGPGALDLARQAARRAREDLHPAHWAGLQLTLAHCAIELDRGHDAETALAVARHVTDHIGGVFLPWYHLSRALLAFHTGRWDDALAEVELGLDCAEPFGMPRMLRAIATLIAAHRGETSGAAPTVGKDTVLHPGSVAWFFEYLPLRASALWDEVHGDSEGAYARLVDGVEHGVGHLPGPVVLGLLAPHLVRLALDQGDTGRARRFARAAQRRADHSGAPHHLGDAYRCLGLLARDPDLLLEAARCYHDAPRPLDEAHACVDAAELLAHRQRALDARELLERALGIYARQGAVWDATRAASRVRAAAADRTSRRRRNGERHGWNALTPTERSVAHHVAGGYSNPEIGVLMSISRRTVSTHVSHILKKLGMASRVELATEVIRRQNSHRSDPRE